MALLDGLVAEGCLDADNRGWLGDWFAELAAHRPARPARVLIHGDIAPQNLIVDPATAQLTGIVDWGDAELADPAADFAKVRPIDLPVILDGYRGLAGEEALHGRGEQRAQHGLSEEPAPRGMSEERALWYHLAWAVARLRDPVPRPGARHWTAPPSSRLLGLLRFYSTRARDGR